MHSQVPYIRLSQDRTHHVGQRADSKLQCGAVFNKGHQNIGDRDFLRCGLRYRKLGKRRMLSFHYEIHLGDMNTLVETTQNAGQVFIDFQYDDISLLDDPLCNASAAGQIKKSVPVHGSHAHHGHIYRQEMSVIRLQIPENHRNVIAEPPVAECSLIGGTVPAVVAEMLPLRVGLDRHDRSEAKIAANLHVKKLIFALRQRRVQKRRKTDICTEIDPVPALHKLYGLLRSSEFSFIFRIKIHILSQGLPILSCRTQPAHCFC